MTSDSREPDTEDTNLGSPARELAQLEQEPSSDFVPIVRRKIYRRTAASQLVNFTWEVPVIVLREMLQIAVGLLKGTKTRA
jgi:hypothetical protein